MRVCVYIKSKIAVSKIEKIAYRNYFLKQWMTGRNRLVMLKFISLRPAGQFRGQPGHCPGWPMPGYGPVQKM